MASNPSILLIGTESSELTACKTVLRQDKLGSHKCVSPSRALKGSQPLFSKYDVCVVMCAEADSATAFIHSLRLIVGNYPLLAVNATGDPDFVTHALEAGADDILPLSRIRGQLVARVKALHRRYNFLDERADRVLLVAGDVKIDFLLHKVWVHGGEVSLSPTEFRILRKLCMNVGRVVPHQDLLMEVWGEPRPEMVDSLRVYIRYIRRKVQETSQLVRIVSRPGIGYMLSVPASA